MLGAIQDATSNRQKSTRQKPTRQIQQNCQLVKSQFVKKPTRQTTNSPKEFSRQNSYIEEIANMTLIVDKHDTIKTEE